jgi:sulfatase modifying factor 1
MRNLRPFIAATLLLLTAGVFAQAPFKPVPGTPMVKTSDFGELPQEVIWSKDGAVMVLVPAGESKLGRDTTGERGSNEGPEHTVTLPSYYIDKYEVSNRSYSVFVEATGGTPTSILADAPLAGPELPVVAVLHRSAGEYARWALKELPSEAMWQKAARGVDGKLFTTGDAPDFSKFVIGLGGQGPTVAVDKNTGDVSPFGVYHMTGNAKEWIADWYNRDGHTSLPADKHNPTGPEKGETRVVMGASYFSEATLENARLTHREPGVPTQTRDDVGFRTVFVLRPAPAATPTPTPAPTPVPFDPMEGVNAAMERLQTDWDQSNSKAEWRAQPPKATVQAEFANFTPHNIKLAYITEEGEISLPGRTLAPCTFAAVDVPDFEPRQATYLAVGRLDELGNVVEVINAGEVSAADGLSLLLPTSLFDQTKSINGDELPRAKEAVQFYDSSYSPLWDEIDIQNASEDPIVLTFSEVDSKQRPVGKTKEVTMLSGEIISNRFKPGMWQIRVTYLGSTENASAVWTFTVDQTAAHRLIRYSTDSVRPDRIQVFAKQLPYLEVGMTEARALKLKGKGKKK